MNNFAYFGFDLETTGAAATDRPVQVALVGENGDILYNTLCNPHMQISKEASAVHGIYNEHLVWYPDYQTALWSMRTIIHGWSAGQYPVLFGYNISMFDIPMMNICLGYDWDGGVLDVLDVVYRYTPDLTSMKLGDVHLALTGHELSGAHGAVQDCIGTLRILETICEKFGTTPEILMEELKQPKAYQILPIGKYKGTQLSSIPYSWASYMRNNADNMRPDLKATVEAVLGG